MLTQEQVKSIYLPIFSKYDIKEVWVFGSYSRNEQTSHSDIDFLYRESDKFKKNPFLTLDLFDDLTAASHLEVDVIEISDLVRVGHSLEEAIMQDKKELSKF